jgi:DnaJ-class molecular chaperone
MAAHHELWRIRNGQRVESRRLAMENECTRCAGSGVEPGERIGKVDGVITGRCSECAGYGTREAQKKTALRPAGDPKPPKDAA